MIKKNRFGGSLPAVAALLLSVVAPGIVQAHCDGIDGPVVKAARQALAKGDVNLALIWIQPGDEPELRQAFAHAMAVRKLSPEAKELADLYFFETVVRIHRAGEGAPYTGLKPAGRDLGPAIPAADNAVEAGSADVPAKLLTAAMADGIRERFLKVQETRNFKSEQLQAGREYVKAYVSFLHYVEGLHAATRQGGHEPAAESNNAAAHQH